jgi:hypothetical protein
MMMSRQEQIDRIIHKLQRLWQRHPRMTLPELLEHIALGGECADPLLGGEQFFFLGDEEVEHLINHFKE